MSVTAKLAAFAKGLRFEDLPPEVVHQAKRVLLDALGCAVGAFDSKVATIVHDFVEELDGPDDKVSGVFFTLLNRYPTKEELDLGTGMIEDFGDEGISDRAWSLMNSPEFLYIQ